MEQHEGIEDFSLLGGPLHRIGFLQVVHSEFIPLVRALSATQSASLAQDIVSGRMEFDAIYSGVAFILVAAALLFLGPARVNCLIEIRG